ncbi:YceI family protein [Geminicoccaceae bacterium 1502E]|nr:YceI family protein [Geminicoccaceae bacterium 1502E]
MRRAVFALAFAAAALPAAVAQAAAAGWRPDPAASSLSFEARQGTSRLTGGFERFEASIEFDPARPEAAAIEVTVDVTSLRLGDPSRRGEVLSQAGLDAGAFARATYETVSVTPLGDDRYAIEARLTLRGVTQPLSHDAVIRVSGDEAHAEGLVPVDRNAFGVGQGPFASEEVMAAEVLVRFAIAARRAGG